MAPRGGSHDVRSPAVPPAGGTGRSESSSGSDTGSDFDRGSDPNRRIAFEVAHRGRRRPFMRGIMVHSLMARGVGFDEAYHTASLVRDRFSDLAMVLYDQAMLAEGSQLQEPATFVHRLNKLLLELSPG